MEEELDGGDDNGETIEVPRSLLVRLLKKVEALEVRLQSSPSYSSPRSATTTAAERAET